MLSAGFGPNCVVGLDGQGNKPSSKEAARWRKGFRVDTKIWMYEVCLVQYFSFSQSNGIIRKKVFRFENNPFRVDASLDSSVLL